MCVNNCTNRNDGQYQSCFTCHGFVSCSNGVLYNNTCSEFLENQPLVWDNIIRRCDVRSSTCDPDYLSLFKWKTVGKNLFWQKLYFFIVFIIPKNTTDACKALFRLTVEMLLQRNFFLPNTTIPSYVTSSFLCTWVYYINCILEMNILNKINCLFVYRLCCSSNTVKSYIWLVRYLAHLNRHVPEYSYFIHMHDI